MRQGGEMDLVAEPGQHLAHVGDVERRAGDREERLRRHQEDAVRRAGMGALRQRRRRRDFGLQPRGRLRQKQRRAAEQAGEAKAAAPGLDLPRQVGSLQAAMDHHGCQELLVLEEVDEAQVAQHGRHLAHRIAAEASGIAFEPPLEREQPGLEDVGADDREESPPARPAGRHGPSRPEGPASDRRAQADGCPPRDRRPDRQRAATRGSKRRNAAGLRPLASAERGARHRTACCPGPRPRSRAPAAGA